VAVARGYLGQPGLTAQRFIRDPFSADAQARMYRTGDVGRWRADGTVEYLGRNDDQVKLRGYRIELGEIEAQLARHAQVKEAAVLVREETPGEKSLVAYVTRRGESDPSAEELRGHLKGVLPQYMVPSAFVVLERLPLSPVGKLDRQRLPAPGAAAYARGEYQAPEGEVEQALARIWQELLKVEQVGRHDNFFELGGHSLLGVKLMARVSEALKTQVPVITMFRYPTIERLAEAIESLKQTTEGLSSYEAPEFEEGTL
jgi:acyl carrier protein